MRLPLLQLDLYLHIDLRNRRADFCTSDRGDFRVTGEVVEGNFFWACLKMGIQKTHGHLYSGKPMTNIDKPMDLGVQHSDKLKLESQNASKRGLGLKMQCKYKKKMVWYRKHR